MWQFVCDVFFIKSFSIEIGWAFTPGLVSVSIKWRIGVFVDGKLGHRKLPPSFLSSWHSTTCSGSRLFTGESKMLFSEHNKSAQVGTRRIWSICSFCQRSYRGHCKCTDYKRTFSQSKKVQTPLISFKYCSVDFQRVAAHANEWREAHWVRQSKNKTFSNPLTCKTRSPYLFTHNWHYHLWK